MKRSKTKRIVLRYRSKKPLPYESPALNQRVGFFDLPLEIRQMIYSFYYGSVELVFQHHAYRTTSPNYLHKRKLSGIPDLSLHQVSKAFATEATTIWHAKSTAFTIIDDCSCEHRRGITDFIDPRRGLFAGVRRRLISLQIMAYDDTEEHLSWLHIMKACPKLNIIDVTFERKYDWLREPQPWWVITDFQEFLYKDPRNAHKYRSYDRDGLLWLLAQLGRGDWRVTERLHEIHYTSEGKSWERALKDGCTLQTDLKYTTGANGCTATSRVFSTSDGIRGRWIEGAAKPMIAEAGSEEWKEMVLTSIDGEDIWALP